MSTIKIGGKERPFSLDMPSFRVAAKRHGVKIKANDFGDLSMDDFAMYLWIGLLAGDHDLTEDEVLKWLGKTSLEEQKGYFQAVLEAIGSFGSLFGEEDAPGKHRESGLSTGDTSSLSPTGS